MSAKRKAPDTAASTEKKAKSTAAKPTTITGFFSTASSSSQSKAPFDVDKWADSLPKEKRDLLKLEIETMDPSWLAILKDALLEPSFLALKKFLRPEFAANRVFPPPEYVYSWTRHTPFDKVKVVIVGQDPYHNPNQAHGLAFSVKPPTKAPPSLKNIFISLKNDFPSFKEPANGLGYLVPWAERGVLMLNTCLTVQPNNANSHANKGWEPFTQKIIDIIAQKRLKGVVFMAWGKPAQQRVAKLNKTTHLILQSCHPSPLAAFKGPVFFRDGEHFKQCNAWLSNKYGEDGPIDWNSINPTNVSLLGRQPAASTSTVTTISTAPKASKAADLADDEAALREAEASEPRSSLPKVVPKLRAQVRAERKAAEEEAKKKAEEEEEEEKEKKKKDESYGMDDDDLDWAEAELKSDQVEEEYIKEKGKGKRAAK